MHYTVNRLTVGALDTNCYILKDGDRRAAAVIDPGGDAMLIKSALHDLDVFPALILLTHGHFDHILALDTVRTAKSVVCIHEKDAERLKQSDLISPTILGYDPWPFKEADVLFRRRDRNLIIEGFSFEVIHTPGHTEGSVCYLFDDLLFTGDTLFRRGIGRTDFAGGDAEKMQKSLALLYNMPGDYAVYPGHESETTLSEERLHNPYLRRFRAI